MRTVIFSLLKKFKALFILILLFLSVFKVNASESLVFGFYSSPDYFELESSSGRFSGFLFDYMEAMSNYSARRVEYQQCEINECMDFLTREQVDVIPVVISSHTRISEFPYEIIPVKIAKAAVFLGLRHGRASLYASNPQRVGYVRMCNDEQSIREALSQRGFKEVRNLVFEGYDSSSQMFEAYRQGTLEGMIIESMRRSVSLPIVAELYDADVYLAVKKGNETLKEQIINSINRMHASEPWLENILNIKYFLSGEPLILTDDELNFLNQRRVIRAVASSFQEPFSYFQNGRHKGLLSDITKIFEHDLGIKFEIIESENITDMFEMIANGQADVVIDLYSDYNWARQKNMRITSPFLDVDYVSVTRAGGMPEKPKIAAPYGYFFTAEYIEKRFPREDISYFSTIRDCVDAVANGVADVTFMKSLIAQTQIEDSGHRNLRTNGSVVFSRQIAMGISARCDPMLVRILNKEIAHLDKPNVRRLSNEIEFESMRRSNVLDLVYSYPLRSIGFISVPLVLIIAFMSYLMMDRRRALLSLKSVYYKNVMTGLHNTRWFEEQIPKIIDRTNLRSGPDEAFVMIVKIKHKELLVKNYEARHLSEGECKWIGKLHDTFPWIMEYAAASELEGIYILGILKQGMSFETLMQDFERADRLFAVSGVSVNIKTVAGICTLNLKTKISMQNAIVSAQMALDDASTKGLQYSVYNEKIEQIRVKHKRIEDLMDKALAENEFEVWIQPKYAIRSRRIIGGEALVRWRSPELGFMQPGEFVPLFEKNAFVIELDYYMLTKIREMQQSRSRDSKLCVPISVNQSGMHFSEDNYLNRMKSLVDKIPLPEGFVELEVTESAFFDINSKDPRRNAESIMNRLIDLGYTFSMDDFSKGYSSVSSLLMLPVDTVKIDMDMLNAAMKSEKARKIFTGVVRLCRSVDIKVICEGVESAEQENMLLQSGCNYGQGYAFSKPMPMALFFQMLDKQHSASNRQVAEDN